MQLFSFIIHRHPVRRVRERYFLSKDKLFNGACCSHISPCIDRRITTEIFAFGAARIILVNAVTFLQADNENARTSDIHVHKRTRTPSTHLFFSKNNKIGGSRERRQQPQQKLLFNVGCRPQMVGRSQSKATDMAYIWELVETKVSAYTVDFKSNESASVEDWCFAAAAAKVEVETDL